VVFLKAFDFDKYKAMLRDNDYIEKSGKISKVIGLTLESEGPNADVGELCFINIKNNKKILSEVVGFKENKVLLMPLGEMAGICNGAKVTAAGYSLRVGVSEQLVGRIIDGLGNPIDGNGKIKEDMYYPIMNNAPSPLQRKRITEILSLGIKAIDSTLTIGKGQRVGILAGSGVGKSTLLGMIARNSSANINVIALIGERGREVKEFIERDLKEEGLKKSIIIVATSEQPALVRLKGAFLATAVAEYFRDKGNDVLLLMDSLTRFAMAQREIGLAIGEPPVSKGYTPSVFSVFPKLLERAGNSYKGSITGLYTVLVDGGDFDEPVTDAARGILDGHIILSRDLANNNHYPPIDILNSISRIMNDIVPEEQKEISNNIKKILAVYKEAEDLINIGAYAKGKNSKIDNAIKNIERINEFLQQNTSEFYSYEEIMSLMKDVIINS
jgi:flagellum-specific ATP synthase